MIMIRILLSAPELGYFMCFFSFNFNLNSTTQIPCLWVHWKSMKQWRFSTVLYRVQQKK